MRHFFALPAVLRAAVILASASQHSFSVQDDLLAFPQYEVRFGETWISELDAQERLLSKPGEAALHEEGSDQDAIGQYHGNGKAEGDDDNDGNAHIGSDSHKHVPMGYEYMVLDGQRWLCSLPLVKQPDESDAVNETLSRVEEEKELARATDRGWELLSGMQDHCVYFISGWWSYRFCYNKGVKQFHQLPQSKGVPAYPPKEDPGVEGYILGTYEKRIDDDEGPVRDGWKGENGLRQREGAVGKRGGSGELVQRGESRYLVQHLAGGTVCDLTGKERNIEVQFHCNPQSGDKISLIKETTTCAYLMVIQTPRLCNDVAFLPPQKDRPNAVTCSPVLAESEIEGYEKDLAEIKAMEREAKLWEAQQEAAAAMGASTLEKLPPLVGDIYLGGHAMIPGDQMIEKSIILGGGKETYVETVATSDGKRLSKEDLEKLGLGDPRAIERLRKELEKRAGGQVWKLDVVDTVNGREYRGIIGEDEEDVNRKKEGGKKSANTKKNSEAADEKKSRKKNKENRDQVEGSEEEFYHEEL